MHIQRAVPGEAAKVTPTGLSLVPFSRAHTDTTSLLSTVYVLRVNITLATRELKKHVLKQKKSPSTTIFSPSISDQLTAAVSDPHNGGVDGGVHQYTVRAESEEEVAVVSDDIVPIHLALHTCGAVAMENERVHPAFILATL